MSTLSLLQELSRIVELLVDDYKDRARRVEERRQTKARGENEIARVATHAARAVDDLELATRSHLDTLEKLDEIETTELMGDPDFREVEQQGERPQVEGPEFKTITGGRNGAPAH